jgi:acyl dehydratase
MIFFDELTIGRTFETPGRTVTETDIVMFAGMTGDYNDNHMNAEAAKKKAFGHRIAHGLLLLALTRGLMFRAKVTGTSAELDFSGIPQLAFKYPVTIGDTIRVVFSVKELLENPAVPDRGTVLFQCNTLNQEGVLVLESTFRIVMRKRV